MTEEMMMAAYQRGWREGCETLIEEYPDERIAMPHKDAMGEGCGMFMADYYTAMRSAASRVSLEIREALSYGTVSMTGSQVIIDFDTREQAQAMFDALTSLPD